MDILSYVLCCYLIWDGLCGRGKGKRERKVKKNHKRASHDVPMANAVDEHLYVPITFLHCVRYTDILLKYQLFVLRR